MEPTMRRFIQSRRAVCSMRNSQCSVVAAPQRWYRTQSAQVNPDWRRRVAAARESQASRSVLRMLSPEISLQYPSAARRAH